MRTTITSKGQATLPKAVREYLKLRPGDTISFRIREDGQVVVSARSLSVDDVAGAFRKFARGTTPTVEQPKAAARDEAVAGVVRSLRRKR